MWMCDNCGREFKNKNQFHSCYRLDIEDHLGNKPEKIQEMVLYVLDEFSEYENIKITPVKSAILLSTNANFLSIKPKINSVEFEFQLGRDVDFSGIKRKVRVSANRVFYIVEISEQELLIDLLMDMFREAHSIIK